MARLAMFLLACALTLPNAAHAIQLHWADGSTDLTFSERTYAVLVVQADSTEGALPTQWTLDWLADSAGVNLVARDSSAACLADTAQASSYDPPSTPADSAAHEVTAHFCSGGGFATIAYFLLDQPGGSKGRLKVVALDPSDPDSMRVIQSNEVTYNGGVEGTYPLTILHATRSHHFGRLKVTVVGAGLTAARELTVAARDTSWRYPLTLTSQGDNAITGTIDIAAPMPVYLAEVGDTNGNRGTAFLAADTFDQPLAPQDCTSHFFGSQDTTNLQLKDFSFVFTGDAWHLFYIRQYQDGRNDDDNTRNFGHAKSTDGMQNWTVEARNVLEVQSGQWDNLHVWAPSIILNPADLNYYMFYTGVQLDTIKTGLHAGTIIRLQRLGVATSLNLTDWTHPSSWIYSHTNVSWAVQDTSTGNGQQFRDPYVMADPDAPGHYLLYYVAVRADSGRYVVGTAASSGNLNIWADRGPLLKTDARITAADRVESPHVFSHHGKWWVVFTANHSFGDVLQFEVNNAGPINPDASTWLGPIPFRSVGCGEHDSLSTVYDWHASEHDTLFYRTPSGAPATHEYMAAFSDRTQTLDFTELVLPPSGCSSDSVALDCPTMVSVADPDPTQKHNQELLALASASPAHSSAVLRLAVPVRMRVRLAVFDLLGRRVRTLIDGEVAPGETRVIWDGRSDAGVAVGQGIYFARLQCPVGETKVHIALLR